MFKPIGKVFSKAKFVDWAMSHVSTDSIAWIQNVDTWLDDCDGKPVYKLPQIGPTFIALVKRMSLYDICKHKVAPNDSIRQRLETATVDDVPYLLSHSYTSGPEWEVDPADWKPFDPTTFNK